MTFLGCGRKNLCLAGKVDRRAEDFLVHQFN